MTQMKVSKHFANYAMFSCTKKYISYLSLTKILKSIKGMLEQFKYLDFCLLQKISIKFRCIGGFRRNYGGEFFEGLFFLFRAFTFSYSLGHFSK